MKNLNVPQPLFSGTSASRFATAALADPEWHESELVAWHDRSTSLASPVLEGCSGSYGRHDYGVSHDGRLEVHGGRETSFIFVDSSSFDSCAHFGPGHFINIRDARGNEMICRIGRADCVPLDDWSNKLT